MVVIIKGYILIVIILVLVYYIQEHFYIVILCLWHSRILHPKWVQQQYVLDHIGVLMKIFRKFVSVIPYTGMQAATLTPQGTAFNSYYVASLAT